MDSLKPAFYLKVFAWIAIGGIACSVFMDYWLPILFGGALFTYLVFKVSAHRKQPQPLNCHAKKPIQP